MEHMKSVFFFFPPLGLLTTSGFHPSKKTFLPDISAPSAIQTEWHIQRSESIIFVRGRHDSFQAGRQKDTKLLESLQGFFPPS